MHQPRIMYIEPKDDGVWLFPPVVVSWIVLAIGYALDSRKYARITPSTTPQRTSDLGLQQRGWVFVAIGLFFLIMVLWTFLPH